jgi:serine/threonine protein kinase
LKPEKVLLDDILDPKITDFGLSKTMSLRRTVIQSHLAGSLPYTAPQALEQNEHCTQEVDIYSCAVLMFNVLTGLHPFEIPNPHAHAQRVVNAVRPNIPDAIVPELAGLMRQCWDGDADRRYCFEQIINFLETPEYLRGVDMTAFRAYQKGLQVAVTTAEPAPGGKSLT